MWLKPENRCLVPFNSFAEYAPEPNPETKKKDVVWFALNEDRPLCTFAGIWTEFKGERGTKSKPVPALTSSTVFSRHRRTRSSSRPSEGHAGTLDHR
jgi:putative SOS response-associated peptidase YedK